MPDLLKPKVALVTGGSRGLGRGIVTALASKGWHVAINFVQNRSAAESTLTEIKNSGGDGAIFQADIVNEADRKRLVTEVWERFGKVDLLVNNAGIAPGQRKDILETSQESFDRILRVNLRGTFFLTQQVAKKMISQVKAGQSKNPKIVTVTSISAYTSSTNRAEYCISKAGLAMMTRLFADRLAEFGIQVFEIRPGIMATDMTAPVKEKYDRLIENGLTPIRRWGLPEDVGKAVLAIANDLLPFSTGEVINVDGGFHLRRL